jgi:phosphoribosylformylglycinamidine synthase
MADALTELGVPVVGGNVSLYNQSSNGPIYPTPVVGMVGALPDASAVAGSGFAAEGDLVSLVAPPGAAASLAGSELAKLRGDALPDGLPPVDVAETRRVIELVRDTVRGGGLSSAHDVAEGGLAVALAECCLAGGVGASIVLEGGDADLDALFGEGAGRFVVSGPAEALEPLAAYATPLGTVGGEVLDIGGRWAWSLDEMREAAHALALAFP